MVLRTGWLIAALGLVVSGCASHAVQRSVAFSPSDYRLEIDTDVSKLRRGNPLTLEFRLVNTGHSPMRGCVGSDWGFEFHDPAGGRHAIEILAGHGVCQDFDLDPGDHMNWSDQLFLVREAAGETTIRTWVYLFPTKDSGMPQRKRGHASEYSNYVSLQVIE